MKTLLMKTLFLSLCIAWLCFCNSLQAQHQWVISDTMRNTYIYTADCLDSNNCVCAGVNHFNYSGGIIKQTTNGGESWFVLYEDTIVKNNKFVGFSPQIHVIKYLTKDIITAACDSNTIMRTTDGGKSWKWTVMGDTCCGIGEFSSYQKKYLAFFSYGKPNSLLYSSDFGENWQKIPIPDSLEKASAAFTIHLLSPTTIIIDAYILKPPDYNNNYYFWLRTDDLGKNWEYLSKATKGYFGAYYLDSLYGWAPGTTPDSVGGIHGVTKLIKTTDGGRTWNQILNKRFYPDTEDFYHIQFIDRNNGVMAGAKGKVLRTSDGGINWSEEGYTGWLDQLAGLSWILYLTPEKNLAGSYGFQYNEIVRSKLVIKSVGNENKDLQIRISKNVLTSGESLDIIFPEGRKNSSEEIYIKDILGQTVGLFTKQSGELRVSLDIGNLSSGKYFIVCKNKNLIKVEPIVIVD